MKCQSCGQEKLPKQVDIRIQLIGLIFIVPLVIYFNPFHPNAKERLKPVIKFLHLEKQNQSKPEKE